MLEFGVFSGFTVNVIAEQFLDRKVYGFDSFEGLPEAWTFGTPKGYFKVEKLPVVDANFELVVGWFSDTLPEVVNNRLIANEPVAFLHVDCDLYSSTKTILQCLKGKMVPGTIIVFDEYMSYPGWRDHEYRAFREFVDEEHLKYEYIGLVPKYEQAAVRILG